MDPFAFSEELARVGSPAEVEILSVHEPDPVLEPEPLVEPPGPLVPDALLAAEQLSGEGLGLEPPGTPSPQAEPSPPLELEAVPATEGTSAAGIEEPSSPMQLPKLRIQDGDFVVLLMPDGRKLTVRAGHGSRGTHYGELDLAPLVGLEYGTAARTRMGQPIYLLRPTLQDHLMTVKRITQIIYPKEVGVILLKLGLRHGSTVIECGTGSGALTIAFAWQVGPTGRVYTYEKEKAHHERARYNLARLNFLDRVTMAHRDAIAEGFDVKGAEAVFLDVREPQELLQKALDALAPGGIIGFLVPTMNQVSDVLRALETQPCIDTEVSETFFRRFKVNANRLRPEDRMVAHTGFLIFSRKIEVVPDYLPPVPARKEKKGAEEDDSADLGSEGGLE